MCYIIITERKEVSNTIEYRGLTSQALLGSGERQIAYKSKTKGDNKMENMIYELSLEDLLKEAGVDRTEFEEE